MTEAKLTLAKAVEFTLCMELAEKIAKSFKGTEASVQKLSSTHAQGVGPPCVNTSHATAVVALTMKVLLAVSKMLHATFVEKMGT